MFLQSLLTGSCQAQARACCKLQPPLYMLLDVGPDTQSYAMEAMCSTKLEMSELSQGNSEPKCSKQFQAHQVASVPRPVCLALCKHIACNSLQLQGPTRASLRLRVVHWAEPRTQHDVGRTSSGRILSRCLVAMATGLWRTYVQWRHSGRKLLRIVQHVIGYETTLTQQLKHRTPNPSLKEAGQSYMAAASRFDCECPLLLPSLGTMEQDFWGWLCEKGR